MLSARDVDGHTLLGLACKAATGNVARPFNPGTPARHAAVDLILRAGAHPSAAANDGWSPLHTAAMAGHVDLARQLLGSVRRGFEAQAGAAPVSRLAHFGSIPSVC